METREQAIGLREATRELVRSLSLLDKDRASCCGVTLSQCHAIVGIGGVGRIAPSVLAELLRLDRSTVTRVVDSLVAQGFVLREQEPADRRSIVLGLTEKGQEFFVSTEKAMEEFYESILKKIPSHERSVLTSGVRAIAKAFEAKGCTCFSQIGPKDGQKEGAPEK
ncbi:MAG: MarR family transcriptional regulator [Thermovirgaceae bacterium]|nr:MarR family transcriptional regulator [Thermovirgaceae bacterium]